MAKMTKTMEDLLLRRKLYYSDRSCMAIDGKRQADAARALVAAGLAKRYESMACMTGGDYYVHPITRKGATTKHRVVIGGMLHFD